MTPPPNIDDSPPARWRPTWRDAIIAIVILINVALPLSYYLGRSDSTLAPFDERFAWRMFSPVRLARCQVAVFDATGGVERPIALQREMHVVWINLLKRARPAVVEATLDRFCGRESGADIRMELICTAPDAASKAICAGANDRDGDGVPDAYGHSPYCDDAPADCFRTECGDRPAALCYQEECRVPVLTRDRNQCADREAT